MQSTTKSLRPRTKLVDYTLNGNHNATPLWLKTKVATNRGCWDDQQQGSNKPLPRKAASGQENQELHAIDKPALSQEESQGPGAPGAGRGQAQPPKRKLNHIGARNKASKRPKHLQQQQQQQEEQEAEQEQEAEPLVAAEAAPVANHSVRANLSIAQPAVEDKSEHEPLQHPKAGALAQAAQLPASEAHPVPSSIDEVLKSMPADSDVNLHLQDILQQVLREYHNLKDITILKTEGIISEQARRFEKALEAKDKLAKKWQEQAQRNEQFLNVNCVQDFKEQIAQLETSLAKARVQQQEAVLLNERLQDQLKMQSLTVDHYKEQLENRGRRVAAAEEKVQELSAAAEPKDLMLQASQAAAQELQQKLAQAEAEAAQLKARLLHPPRPRCRNVAIMARPTAKEVEVQTDVGTSGSLARVSIAVGPDEPSMSPHKTDASVQCPTPTTPAPGIGIQVPTPPPPVNARSPLPAPAGLTLEEWQAIWYNSQPAQQLPTAQPGPSPAPADMDIDDEDDSPVRGLTNGSPLKQAVPLEHSPACLCPEGIEPPSSDRLPFMHIPSPPASTSSHKTPQPTLHCGPLDSPTPAAPTPAAAARPILGLPPAAGDRFAGRKPITPADTPAPLAEQQPACSTPACFTIGSGLPTQQPPAPDCDRESASAALLAGALLLTGAVQPQVQEPATDLPLVAVPADLQPLLRPQAAAAGQLAPSLPNDAIPVRHVQVTPEFSFPVPTSNTAFPSVLRPGNSNNSSLLAVDGRPVTKLSGLTIVHDSTTNDTMYTDSITGFQFRIGQPPACCDSGPATPGTPGQMVGAWQHYENPLCYEVLKLGLVSPGAVGPAGTDTFVFAGAAYHAVMECIFKTLGAQQLKLTGRQLEQSKCSSPACQ